MTRWFRNVGVALATALLPAAPLIAQALPLTAPEAVGMSTVRLERLSAVLQEYVDHGRVPGSVTIIVRRGKVVYLEGFGHRDRQAADPMAPDAIFRIASQSKALVSVAVMMLQEEGKLLIADAIGDYLPEFLETTVAVPDDSGGYTVAPAERPITIRDLLTHSAGIGYGGGVASDRWQEAGITGWYFADRDEPIGATVARMAEIPFATQPGDGFTYGYATDILGHLVERVSGSPLDVFLEQRITGPLGMDDTHFYLPADKVDRLTVVYSHGDDGTLERAPDPGGMVGQGAYVDGPRQSFSGGAGLLSTATDYARFLQMLLNGGELDGVRLLSRKSVEQMTVRHLPLPARDGLGFGLGFMIVTDLGLWGGMASTGAYFWGGAYHSVYWVDPVEQLVLVHFTQIRPVRNLDDLVKVRTLAYQAIVD
jgi:CubicO group peptidase (beta-lactamase class C family)